MTDETSDEQNARIASALQKGDQSVLADILRLYAPDIIELLHSRFVTRMRLLRYEDIEDVVSIALRRLWAARLSYDSSKQSIRVWLYCISENAAKDVLKHGWHKARKLEHNPGHEWLDERPADHCPTSTKHAVPDTKKESKEAIDLGAALAKLPDDQRKIVMADAASRDGMASNEFLEAELDIPASHVRVYRSRAYATLRKEMKRLGHNIPDPKKATS